MMPLRVLIVDGDSGVRASIRAILGGLPAVMVVGEADTTTDGVAKLTALQPDAVVLETDGDAANIADIARRFPSTAILATGFAASADTIIQVIRAGALEFLRRPVERADLVGALDKLARFRETTTTARQRGHVTAVFSSKGGLGTTTVAVNLAVALASSARGALVVELDTRPSDVVTLLDLQPRYSVLDAIESVERLDEALLKALLIRHESGVAVLPGPTRPERHALVAERVHLVVEFLASRFDHVVLDLRHDVDPPTAAALEAADRILYLTAPNVSALRMGAAGLTAFRQWGIDGRKVRVVLMRDGTGGDVTPKHVREALGLPVFWRLPSDYRAAIAAVNSGQPIVSLFPRSRLAHGLRELGPALVTEAREASRPPEKRRLLFGASWAMKRLL